MNEAQIIDKWQHILDDINVQINNLILMDADDQAVLLSLNERKQLIEHFLIDINLWQLNL